MITRRTFLTAGTLAITGAAAIPRLLSAEPRRRLLALPSALARIEMSSGGRLGVAILDTGSGEKAGHRAAERFAMCSTFKMLLAAAVLHRSDTGREHLDRSLAVPPKPLLGNSPLTEEHAGAEMTISALCHAAMTRSDNTAANLLLATIGGPGGVTRFARSMGDTVTRLDRIETSLNEAAPGDPRDTTSPDAMLGNLQKVLFGDVLTRASCNQLTQWMTANKTGGERLRSALPPGWRGADKTGSSGTNTTNDIACLWPETGAPVLVTAYLTECAGPEAKRNAVLAEIGKLVVSSMQSV